MTPDSELSSVTIDCGDLPVREINQLIRAAIAAGATDIRLLRPAARIIWAWPSPNKLA